MNLSHAAAGSACGCMTSVFSIKSASSTSASRRPARCPVWMITRSFSHLDEFLLPQLTAPFGQLQVAAGKAGRNDLLPFDQEFCCLFNIFILRSNKVRF